MVLVTGNKKIIKAGSSDVITVTKDVPKLNLSAGDYVDVALMAHSESSSDVMRILQYYDNGLYEFSNAFWIPEQPNADSSQYINPYVAARADMVEILFHIIRQHLDHYVRDLGENQGYGFYYNEGLGSFIRTAPDLEENEVNNSWWSFVFKERITLGFLKFVLDDLPITNSVLKQTANLSKEIDDLIDKYDNILSGEPSEETICSRIKAFNNEWDLYQDELLKESGMYVEVVTNKPLYDDSGALFTWGPSVITEFGISRAIVESRLKQEMNGLVSDDSLVADPDYRVFGPFSEDDATEFSKYLEIGINLNFDYTNYDRMFDWCEQQSSEYRKVHGYDCCGFKGADKY